MVHRLLILLATTYTCQHKAARQLPTNDWLISEKLQTYRVLLGVCGRHACRAHQFLLSWHAPSAYHVPSKLMRR
jgi:hypothetical protein